ncbi:MAG: TetR/AcrR family transcriptional regulator [Actinomycetota bacterium]|nr:TetR/AcrR family transcriptional regulator [Actinomycetota bacterium]
MGSTGTQEDSGRTWRGQSAEQRRAERRSRLIEAGIELFGSRGYAHTPVKAVCEEAGLTERYFYEAFDDREGLLSEIYDQLIRETAEQTLNAIESADDDLFIRLRVGLEVFFHSLTRDPRRARIQEIEVVGVSEELERKRRQAIHAFAGIISDQVRRDPGWNPDRGIRLDVIAVGLVGSVNEQLIDYVLGNLEIEPADLLRHQSMLFTAMLGPLITE